MSVLQFTAGVVCGAATVGLILFVITIVLTFMDKLRD